MGTIIPIVEEAHIMDPLVLDRGTDRWRPGRRSIIPMCDHYGVDRVGAAHDADTTARNTGSLINDMIRRAAMTWGEARAVYGDRDTGWQEIFERWQHLTTMGWDGLMETQRHWHTTWATGFKDHLRRSGKPHDAVNTHWPIIPRPA